MSASHSPLAGNEGTEARPIPALNGRPRSGSTASDSSNATVTTFRHSATQRKNPPKSRLPEVIQATDEEETDDTERTLMFVPRKKRQSDLNPLLSSTSRRRGWANVPYNSGFFTRPDGTLRPFASRLTPSSPSRIKAALALLQLTAIIPAVLGVFYSLWRAWKGNTYLRDKDGVGGIRHMRTDRSEWVLAALWSAMSGQFCISMSKGLTKRWLVYYPLPSAMLRLASLQALCWPLTRMAVVHVFGHDQPLAGWMLCCFFAAVSNLGQIWVTSNLHPSALGLRTSDEKRIAPWASSLRLSSSSTSSPAPIGKPRGLRANQVIRQTVMPLAVLSVLTMWVMMVKVYDLRYGGGLYEAYTTRIQASDASISRHLATISSSYHLNSTYPFTSASTLKVLALVTSSWTARSFDKRSIFRNSSALLIPSSTPNLEISYRFVIGTAPSPKIRDSLAPAIEAEAAKYGDMIAVPAHDGYTFLSQKVFEGMRWASGFEDVDYFIKTDDDMLVRFDVIAKELQDLGKRKLYWRGLAYWDIPPIRDASNKNAVFDYDMNVFPPYVAGALYILSKDLLSIVALPGITRRFTPNEDQSLGIWLYPYNIAPIHDKRIQQAHVCEDDMIAKHFSQQYQEPLNAIDMYQNIINGKRLCEGFLQKYCGLCYPSCRGRSNHWRDWGFECDPVKGITLTESVQKRQAQLLAASEPVKTIPEAKVMGSDEDPWIIPGLLTTHTSTFANTDDWHLLHMVCWTTPPSTFQQRHYETLESVFIHEPRAVIFMMSTTLPLDFFDSYTKFGYKIHVVRVGQKEFLENGWYLGEKSKEWLQDWDRVSQGPNFFSHLTDYLRYLFLFRFGGTYMDMDAPWIRRAPNSNLEFIGADYSTVESDLVWTLDADGTYLAPGVMRFKAGWTMFRDISELAFDPATYSLECFNCVGPRAITSYVKMHRRELELAGFTIIPNFVLYPKGWQQAHILTIPSNNASAELREIAKHSWSIHLFGKMTNHLQLQQESIIDKAAEAFSLRIPRALGRLSTSSDAMETGEHLGKGLELVAPGRYTYRSRLSLIQAEEDHIELLGSLEGTFQGFDTIYLRGTTHSSVAHTEIHISAKHGKITLSSPVARIQGGDSTTGSLSGAQTLTLHLTNNTLQEVNVLLSTLIYTPPSQRQPDSLSLLIKYGTESVSKLIELET